jgi:hypothetical protein
MACAEKSHALEQAARHCSPARTTIFRARMTRMEKLCTARDLLTPVRAQTTL